MQRNCHSLSQLLPEERVCVRKTVTREYKYRRRDKHKLLFLVVPWVFTETDMLLPEVPILVSSAGCGD